MVIQNSRWSTVIHVCIVVLVAALLTNTLLQSFTSMLALKSSVEVKDYQMSDLYSTVNDNRSLRRLDDQVLMVGVDALDRDSIALVVEAVKSLSPRTIGIDIFFDKRPNTTDSTLIDAIDDGRIVMAAGKDADSELYTSWFCADWDGSRLGVVNMEMTSPTDVVRSYRGKYTIGESDFYSLPVAILCAGGMTVPCIDGTNLIYFPGLEFRQLDGRSVLEDAEMYRNIVSDKIVLIGDVDNVWDKYSTPVGIISGLQIHATVVDNIIEDRSVKEVSIWLNWLIAVAACALIIWIRCRWSLGRFSLSAFLLRVLQLGMLYLFFYVGCCFFAKYVYIDFAQTLSMIALSLLVDDFYLGITNSIKNHITIVR